MLMPADLVERIETLEERVAASCLEDWQERECVWAVEKATTAAKLGLQRRSEQLRLGDIERAHYYLDRLEMALEGITYFHEHEDIGMRHVSHEAARFLAAKADARKAAGS